MFKADTEAAVKYILPIIQEAWNTERIPETWKKGLLVKLPKKGDLSLCSNWRGINLLNSISKILARIIHNRLSSVLDPLLRKEQAGFRPQRSCVNQINTLRIIVEQSVEMQSPLYMVFVDFERAFDSVNRDFIFKALEKYYVPEKIIRLIKEMYKDCTSQVLHNGSSGEPISLISGVKQGCILSPLLFTIVLDCVMRQSNQIPKGIQWGLMERLEDLDFADDICMLSHRRNDMQEKLLKLEQISKVAGLKINVSKTKLIRVGDTVSGNFKVNNQDIEEVKEFCYLGSIINNSGGTDPDVERRVRLAKQMFGVMNSIWRSTKISQNLKLKLYRSNCKAVLLYACETWKTSGSIMSRLQVFQNNCLRRIFRIFWPNKIRNEDLWEKAKMENINIEIKRRKWNWIGHVLRLPADEIPKQALDWNPQGNRKRGRPKMTWRRTVLEEATKMKKSWSEIKSLAQNRIRYRSFVDALCSSKE